MSYILDALKKAESERKLGSVPNLYAPAPTVAAVTDAQNGRAWLPWVLVTAILIALALGLAWVQPWRPAAPIVQTTAPVIAATPPITPPIMSPAKQEPVMVETTNKPKPIIPHPLPTPAHVAQANPTTISPATPIKETVLAEALPEEESVSTARNLPQNIQAELPAIVVNGYIYAKNPVDRSVLINQKLLHEGDQITPELVLEKMLPKGAILNYKGYRYRVAF